MAVVNLWRERNLRGNPFFQDALEPGTQDEGVHYPIELFVGRTEEARRIATAIVMNTPGSSRSAIQGVAGVGKTTLVQYIKKEVSSHRIGSATEWVSIGREADAEKIVYQILDHVYRIVIDNGDITTRELEPVKASRQLLLAYQTRGGGASIGLPGGPSAGFTTSVQHHTGPAALKVQGPHLLRQLANIALDHIGLQGILIHMNNLENLADAQAERAAQVLRELRDPCFMIPGLHYILVGTDNAIRTVISNVPQLQSVFGVPEIVEPLSADDVERLLDKRYDHLKIDPGEDVPPLVTSESLRELYGIFRGDLRGTFQALTEAATRIAMLGERPTDPMEPKALRGVLSTIYTQMLTGKLTHEQIKAVRRIEQARAGEHFTQTDVQAICNLSKGRTSEVIAKLVENEIVVPNGFTSGGAGRPAQLYHLAGRARLAFS